MTKQKPPEIDPILGRKLLTELAKRQESNAAAKVHKRPTQKELELADQIEGGMYDKQLAAWGSPAKRKVICGSRRIGKTTMLVRGTIATLLRHPTDDIFYIGPTLKKAKKQFFDEIKEFILDLDLPLTPFEADGSVRHERGRGVIMIAGAETQADIDNLVGYKPRLAVLDESGQFGAKMESAVLAKIGPSLEDLDGTLFLVGTPSDYPEGLFYEAAEGINKTFKSFHWDMRNNPFMRAESKDYDAIIAKNGFSGWDDPTFVREYLGRFAVSVERQVFAFDPKKNTYPSQVPPDLRGYEFLLGLDLGVSDKSAIAVLAFKRDTLKLVLVEDWGKSKASVDELAGKLKEFMAKYRTRKIVADKNGLGKGLTEELWRRYSIFTETAEKRDKLDFISTLNSWLKSGNLVMPAGCQTAQEMPYILWGNQPGQIAHHAKDDHSHALLYAFRTTLPFIKHVEKVEVQADAPLGTTQEPEKEARLKQLSRPITALADDFWAGY